MSPEPTFPAALETSRLELRAYQEADAEALVRLVGSNHEVLRRNFHDTVKRLATADAARSYIRDTTAQREERKVFHFGVWSRKAPELMGQIKVKNVAWDVPSAEISYFIGAGFQRRGYATEAVQAVLREAFEALRFNRIYARVIVSNHESLQLTRKLGMAHEGLHRQEFRCGYGELHDVHYFSLLRDEYVALT
ncbi:MAG TPA: GNAT family N-acetyltransferase [Gammaproteobacteria bacterium]|nr:GNAT family N-acetyltransferase [Gammaproteobacteria bacterium]